jgi:molecular chaperone GrpE
MADAQHPSDQSVPTDEGREPVSTPDASRQNGESDAGAPQAEASGEIERLRRERDENYDRLLRKTAEFENYRRRMEKERRELAQYAASDLLEALLPIIDDFERALRADAGADPDAYRKGVELIYKQLQDLLARRGVTTIEAVGKDFDPRFHQAITHEESPGHREGEVIDEVRRGYMHGERLLRPSMVKVAKA